MKRQAAVGALLGVVLVGGAAKAAGPELVGSSTPEHDQVIGQGTPSPNDSTAHPHATLSKGLPAPPLESDPARPALPAAPKVGTAAIGAGGGVGPAKLSSRLYLSSVDLPQPNQSAVAGGDAVVKPEDPTSSGLPAGLGGTGIGDLSCGSPNSARYTAIALPSPLQFTGTPSVHLRTSSTGTGTFTVQLMDGSAGANQTCRPVATGSTSRSSGDAIVSLSLSRSAGGIPAGDTPLLVVTVAGSGQATIHSMSANPSYVDLATTCNPTLCS